MAHRRSSLFLALTLLSLLAACSGGSNGSSSTVTPPVTTSPPEPETIHGVATPSSVSVVTATNAT